MSAVADDLLQEVRRLRGVVREQGETIERQNERIDENDTRGCCSGDAGENLFVAVVA